jgi:hypothetical protein
MAKLTKQQRKAHAEAEAILTKDRITDDERDFVFQNWHEGATHENGAAGAFFTPFGLACDFALDGAGRRVIDLCAGIGVLSYIIHHRSKWGERLTEVTCVEINPRYVAVGQKLLPQARWINADVFDWRRLDLGRYDVAIANPPFDRVRRSGDAPRYRSPSSSFTSWTSPAKLRSAGHSSCRRKPRASAIPDANVSTAALPGAASTSSARREFLWISAPASTPAFTATSGKTARPFARSFASTSRRRANARRRKGGASTPMRPR